MSALDLARELQLRKRFATLVATGPSLQQRHGLSELYHYGESFGLDAQRLHFEALQGFYGEAVATRPVGLQDAGFGCPHCGKVFGTQAALSGHGPDRCRERLGKITQTK